MTLSLGRFIKITVLLLSSVLSLSVITSVRTSTGFGELSIGVSFVEIVTTFDVLSKVASKEEAKSKKKIVMKN